MAASEAQSQDGSPIQLVGTLGTSRVDAGNDVSFALTFINVSERIVRNLRVVHVGGDNVELKTAGWCADTAWPSLDACPIAAELTPGQTITVQGNVHTRVALSSNITATVVWEIDTPVSAGAGATTPRPSLLLRSSAVLPVGTLTVESWRVRWAGYVTAWLTSLGIPIGGGIIALWLKGVERRRTKLEQLRERRRIRAENRQREERENADRDQAERAAAWRLMLPVSHEYAVKHYADMVESAFSFEQATRPLVGAAAAREKPALEASFYAWVMVFVGRNAFLSTGAYYFKSHIGELLVVQLYRAYSRLFISEIQNHAFPAINEQRARVRHLLEGTADVVPPRSTSRFVLDALHSAQRWQGGPLPGLYEWFEGRLGRPGAGRALDYLTAYAEVLFFEMNRPYAPWFERKTPLKISDRSLEALFALEQLLAASGGPQPFTRDELETYLRDAGVEDARLRMAPAGAHLTALTV